MKCQLENRAEVITAYIADELADAEKLGFEAHYFECADCFRELKIAADATVLIEQEGHSAFARQPSRLRNLIAHLRAYIANLLESPWRRSQIAIVVGALVLIIGLPFAYFQFTHKTVDPQAFAANFEKSPAFESLMYQINRSNQFISEVEPNNEQSFDDKISFRWELQENYADKAGTLKLQIMDNRERELYSYQITGNRLDFDEKLAPGVYYWALLSEKEMIYLGRFYVGRK